jgi:crotonobetainyl-CoA:carnitine CoA-transferase CaiB-like acyl-CoA transferase
MPGALDGLLVADFSRVLAGPYATMLLADLGATVVKVERPGAGDDTRAWGPPYAADGQSTYFQSVNRNKLSVALDLKDPGDLGIAEALAGACDVLVENYRPGQLARLGLGFHEVAARNPGVIYCSISGFGSREGSELPGYDLLVQAMGGLMSITGTEEPTKAGVALVDVLAGLHATVGILAALNHRASTGQGQHLDVTLLGSLQSALVNQISSVLGSGMVPRFLGNAHPSICPYEVFETADRPLVLAVGNDAQFRRLAQVIGDAGLADDPRFCTNAQRVAHRDELVVRINELLSARAADAWQEAITAVGVPCGPINDIAQGIDLATSLGLEPVVTVDDPRRAVPQRHAANPVRYSRTPAAYHTAPPDVDEDRAVVLALLESAAAGVHRGAGS